MISQLLFADSLSSTLLDWLSYATGLPVLACLHPHIQLILESLVEPVLSCSNDVGEVMYQTSLTRKRSSINPVP